MKHLILSLIVALFGSAAFAGLASKNIMTCTDQTGRVLDIDQMTGATGGTPGSYVATLQSSEGRLLVAEGVAFEHMDTTHPAHYTGKKLRISIDSIILMHLAANERTGTLKVGNETAVQMLCRLSGKDIK